MNSQLEDKTDNYEKDPTKFINFLFSAVDEIASSISDDNLKNIAPTLFNGNASMEIIADNKKEILKFKDVISEGFHNIHIEDKFKQFNSCPEKLGVTESISAHTLKDYSLSVLKKELEDKLKHTKENSTKLHKELIMKRKLFNKQLQKMQKAKESSIISEN